MPQILVLVGLPGCGKTAFANLHCVHHKNWVRINQEEIGSRSVCESMTFKSVKEGKNVIIDRCNFDENQRKVWVNIGEHAGVPVDALFFDIPGKTCKERVLKRSGHPTGVEGKFGVGVVDKFESVLTRPTVYEGFRSIHNISTHLPNKTKVEEVYTRDVIINIGKLFFACAPAPPPSPPAKPASAPKPKGGDEKVEAEKKAAMVASHFGHDGHHAHHGHHHHHHGHMPKMSPPGSPSSGPKNVSVVAKPIEGHGTFKESRGTWEDEAKNKHFTHSLYNEHAEQEADGSKHLDRHTRHLQHSNHISNPTSGFQRAFDHLTLDRQEEGHQLDKSGKKTHFSDKSHYYHQNEHEEDAKKGTMRTYEHKHVNNMRHIHSDKPDKSRLEGFEHRSFNYAYKGEAFEPSCVMDTSYSGKAKFDDEIKASFHNLPAQEHYSFGQKISWEGGIPPAPRMPNVSFMHAPK
ncbi:hypothetical protein IWQ60_003765 [Tieghemiomyces parasiticus]|uniref:Uncharacterized protein n=1 Tax=Tieghemiomyces parasiticus TaxID=78921 RepID=A0A9W8DKS8_9FUNG|nr:hypothetical protein IWQ60_012382 [Tieghemiomyces parasiticus]KAJ1926490.1 hypothetical protein IWQ60_003765 [Tieghemiomyces parasiticus]